MCSICSFHEKRTSEVKLPLLERVEVREGVVDEIRRQAHHLGRLLAHDHLLLLLPLFLFSVWFWFVLVVGMFLLDS